MFSPVYFPLVSALAAGHERTIDRLVNGHIGEAVNAASRLVEGGGDESSADLIRLQSDLSLATGHIEDAEEGYRRALRAMRSSRQLRALSCRDTGWQALFRQRPATAVACFSRVVAEEDLSEARRLEARFALVVSLGELGRPAEMESAILELEQAQQGAAPRWGELVRLLRYDLAVQRELRQAGPLSDHVYWQSMLGESSLPPDHRDRYEAEVAIEAPLLLERFKFLRKLRAFAAGERHAYLALDAHLRWAQQVGLGEYQRALRVETALAALACNEAGLAEQALMPLAEQIREGSGRRRLEYLYCTAKIRQEQGRTQEGLRLYSRYALLALRASREESRVATPFAAREGTRRDAPLDDVAARLPAKYRRAYRFLLANLDRRDLSVREVAAEIGVTERALQTAFKNFIGLTPTEVIRRQRMEAIRAELQSDDHDGGVLDAAHRWGVTHRSTLVNGYRKYFHEAPSETLAR